MALKLITAPTVEPISLVEAKAHLRITESTYDDMIEMLIGAVRQSIDGKDGVLQRALVTQTWDLYLDCFPGHEIRIPLPPLQSITHVKYDDADGNEQTVASVDYTVDAVNEPGWVIHDSASAWPTTFDGVNAVRIRFVAGYPPTTDSPPDLTENVPLPIKQAMLLMLRDLWGMGERNLFVSAEDVPGVGSRSFVVSENAAKVVRRAAESLLAAYRVWV